MFVVVSYDIIDDQRRNKIANALKDYGSRVQKSVFECNISRIKFDEMVKELLRVYDSSEDSIRIYYLCESCLNKVKVCGVGKLTEDEDMFII